jgi:putative oxidoreductase
MILPKRYIHTIVEFLKLALDSNMNGFYSLLTFIGRLSFGLFFIWKSVFLLAHWSESTQTLENFSIQAIPIWLILSFIFQFAGGFSLLLGYWARWGTLLIALNLLFVLFTGVNWSGEVSNLSNWGYIEMYAEKITLLGIAFAFIGIGSGSWSLDRRYKRKG